MTPEAGEALNKVNLFSFESRINTWISLASFVMGCTMLGSSVLTHTGRLNCFDRFDGRHPNVLIRFTIRSDFLYKAHTMVSKRSSIALVATRRVKFFGSGTCTKKSLGL